MKISNSLNRYPPGMGNVPSMKLTLQQLEAHLWGAANILRGKTAGQDYKNYILSLMFYKRLAISGNVRQTTRSLSWSGSRGAVSQKNRRRCSVPVVNIDLIYRMAPAGAT